MFGLAAHGPALLRPREVEDWHDEEAIRCIGDTSEGVVPGQEGSEEPEITTCLVAGLVWSCCSVLKVPDAEAKEGQIEGEEEEEEGHRRFERAEEKDEREDEPGLTPISI